MAYYAEVSEETEELFSKVLETTSLENNIEFKLFSNEKLKGVYQLVKASDIWEKVTNGVNFVLVINEVIFDQLETRQKELILEEALCGISINMDSGKISNSPPDFTTFKGMIRKYGSDEMIRLKESVFALLDQKKEKEAEEEV